MEYTKKYEQYSDNFLNEFEEMNITTESIYELEGYDVLIILKDGRNYTDYNLVNNKNDIIYISENIQNKLDLTRKYNFPNLKALIIQNFNKNVKSLDYMFYSSYNLEKIVCLDDWDVSNVTSMHAMFKNCFNLSDITFLKKWDVSSVVDMAYMFENCPKIDDLSSLKKWNTMKLENMDSMFRDCTGLVDLNALRKWNVINVKSMNNLFENCHNLVDIDTLLNWDINPHLSINNIISGCVSLHYYVKRNKSVKDNTHILEYQKKEKPQDNKDSYMATTILNQPNNDGFIDLSYDLNMIMKVLEKKI